MDQGITMSVAGAPPSAAAKSAQAQRRPHLMVLCGLVGSGKSTFAQGLAHHDPPYHRASQDVLGNRQATIAFANQALSQGENVVVDRTNVDAQQRLHWVRLGERCNARIDVIVFDTPYEVCAERLRLRQNHETLHDPKQALFVLSTFAHQFRMPTAAEGFEHLLVIPATKQPAVWSTQDIKLALVDLDAALGPPPPPLTGASQNVVSAESHRGAWRGRGRGMGRGRGRGAPDFVAQPSGRPPPWRNAEAFPPHDLVPPPPLPPTFFASANVPAQRDARP